MCGRRLGPALFVATTVALVAAWQPPSWLFMWVLAFAIFAGFKWLTYREAVVGGLAVPPLTRWLYLFCWPGMSFQEFPSPAVMMRGSNLVFTCLPAVCCWVALKGVSP